MTNDRGKELVKRVKGFVEALKTTEKIPTRFTCRTVKLNLEPRELTAQNVRDIRDELGTSQAIFALVLGVSPKTVQDWEQGLSQPQPIACRFLEEIHLNPGYWRGRIEACVTSSGPAQQVTCGE